MVVEKEFKKITGPKSLYGYVKINAKYTDNPFSYESLVIWPKNIEITRFEENICRGIKDAISEYGYTNLFGTYVLEEIIISKNEAESVPIAYYWAAKKAIQYFLQSKEKKE